MPNNWTSWSDITSKQVELMAKMRSAFKDTRFRADDACTVVTNERTARQICDELGIDFDAELDKEPSHESK